MFLYIRVGVPCEYIVNIYCSLAKKNCSDPHFLGGGEWRRHWACGQDGRNSSLHRAQFNLVLALGVAVLLRHQSIAKAF